MGDVIQMRPQKGPQEAFLATPADICFYGGAAGGGKSYASALDIVRHIGVKGFSAIFFRRTSPQLTGPGSIWEEMRAMYSHTNGVAREGKELDWRWPSGASLALRHMQHEKDRFNHQGFQYAGIYFDELTHFTAAQFWYLVSRNRSTCGVRPYIRATCNPDPDSWVREMIDWWIDDEGFAIPERSGVLRYFLRVDESLVWADTAEELEAQYPHLTTGIVDGDGNPAPVRPKSFTFIAAKLTDNPALMTADPGYMANLLALPRVERERLLGGNWNIKPAAGLYFRRSYFQVVDAIAEADVARRARGWDLAATAVTAETPDPDYTASIKLAVLKDGRIAIEHMTEERVTPAGVERGVVSMASQDGRRCVVAMWQDPGQAGKAQAAGYAKLAGLRGYRVRFVVAGKDKITYAGALSSQAEVGNVVVVRGDWNERFFQVFEAFPDGAHDDAVDASSRAMLEVTSKAARWLQDMEAAKARHGGKAA